MHRLLQGDVGSGKTAVAFLSMLAAAGSGCQAALMAPTEVGCLRAAESSSVQIHEQMQTILELDHRNMHILTATAQADRYSSGCSRHRDSAAA